MQTKAAKSATASWLGRVMAEWREHGRSTRVNSASRQPKCRGDMHGSACFLQPVRRAVDGLKYTSFISVELLVQTTGTSWSSINIVDAHLFATPEKSTGLCPGKAANQSRYRIIFSGYFECTSSKESHTGTI
jgi:hypothetical protein